MNVVAARQFDRKPILSRPLRLRHSFLPFLAFKPVIADTPIEQPPGFGFVETSTGEDAQRAIAAPPIICEPVPR